jgi:hypothetical protein
MPFSETIHKKDGAEVKTPAQEWSFIFDEWIKKAVESYPKEKIKCIRSDSKPGNFVKGIVKDIYDSELVIADLTGQKPNVYYELGIRHSLRLGTIIITQELSTLPSDLASYYCFGYEYTKEAYKLKDFYIKFEKDLHNKIDHIFENKNLADNPVADFLDLKHYYQGLKKEKQVNDLKLQVSNILIEIKEIFARFKELQDYKDEYLNDNKFCFAFFDIAYFDAIYLKLLNSDFSELSDSEFNEFMLVLKEIRKGFVNIYQYWEGARTLITKSNTETFYLKIDTLLKIEPIIIEGLEKWMYNETLSK